MVCNDFELSLDDVKVGSWAGHGNFAQVFKVYRKLYADLGLSKGGMFLYLLFFWLVLALGFLLLAFGSMASWLVGLLERWPICCWKCPDCQSVLLALVSVSVLLVGTQGRKEGRKEGRKDGANLAYVLWASQGQSLEQEGAIAT